jgi:hypothetical protein
MYVQCMYTESPRVVCMCVMIVCTCVRVYVCHDSCLDSCVLDIGLTCVLCVFLCAVGGRGWGVGHRLDGARA